MKIKKSGERRARKFTNTFRFIDDLDLTMLNNSGEFERSFREIYTPESKLKIESDINIGSSLDLEIKIKESRFSKSLHDKPDDFPFSLVRMCYLWVNIPSKTFYYAF